MELKFANVSNIVVFSHRLHVQSEKILASLYPGAVFWEELYHCEDRSNLEFEIDEIIDRLKAKGALHGRVVITPPSISSATALLMIALFRETGQFPDLVNMIQVGGIYRPDPKTPIFKGQAYGDRRRKARAN